MPLGFLLNIHRLKNIYILSQRFLNLALSINVQLYRIIYDIRNEFLWIWYYLLIHVERTVSLRMNWVELLFANTYGGGVVVVGKVVGAPGGLVGPVVDIMIVVLRADVPPLTLAELCAFTFAFPSEDALAVDWAVFLPGAERLQNAQNESRYSGWHIISHTKDRNC